jgi:hypothetical protein
VYSDRFVPSRSAGDLSVEFNLAANAAQAAIISRGSEKTQVLHGLVAELSLPAPLAEVLVPFIEVREPTDGLACATVTFAGIVGSLVGLNSQGLAASTALLLNAGKSTTRRQDGLGPRIASAATKR